MTTIADFSATAIDGTEQDLAAYEGKAVLVVNSASKCGFTPQYEGLETLYARYRDDGLVVLGFPCDQFRNQEPGDEAEIAEFCQMNYGVSFPLFAKVDVNGEHDGEPGAGGGGHEGASWVWGRQPGRGGWERVGSGRRRIRLGAPSRRRWRASRAWWWSRIA